MVGRLLLNFFIFGSIVSCQNKTTAAEIELNNLYKLSSEIEKEVELDTVPWKYQISAGEFAKNGDYKNALKHWDLAMPGRNKSFTPNEKDSINLKYTIVDASDYILSQAKNREIIIINEAHHNSFHRVFTRSLLGDLYEMGYKNLGLEALSNGNDHDSLLNERKYPIQNSGYYTKDPQFGEMIRIALEIGYDVFPYEDTSGGNGKTREIEQAKNIKFKIDSKPEEKFLIHCGFDHVLEGSHRSWEYAMAERLKALTDLDPLTIHQVAFSERGNTDHNHPMLKSLDISNSSVLLDEYNKPYKYERGDSWADIAIFHPNTLYENNRPSWVFDEERNKVYINLDQLDIEFPIMVLAYKKSEAIETAIPVDITELESKKDSCLLGLRSGDYRIIVTNGQSSLNMEKKVD